MPEIHTHGVDARPFLEGLYQRIEDKLQEELRALKGIKFQLALKIQNQKSKTNGAVENTDPVLRHKQEALLQNSEISKALNKTFSTILELLEKWTQRGSGWAVDHVQILWLDVTR